MSSKDGVYNLEELKSQLGENNLNGDAMLTLKWLLSEYLKLRDEYKDFTKFVFNDLLIRKK